MARYIDAEKLEEALRSDYDREGKKAYTYAAYGDDDLSVKYSHGQFCYLNAMERVKDAPAADVAPRAEVAREIFEEIEELFRQHKEGGYYLNGAWFPERLDLYTEDAFEELKKKYTEGGK
jgi:hypothetical protein